MIAAIRDNDEGMFLDGLEKTAMEFRRMLMTENGIDLDKLVGSNKKVAKIILRRGKIKSTDEFRIMDGFVDQLAQKENRSKREDSEIEKANALIVEFEQTHSPRQEDDPK